MKEQSNTIVQGFLKIYDPNSLDVYFDGTNSIHYENFSEAMSNTLANKGIGQIYQMSFGNGGTNVDATGVITYLPPNTIGQNSQLYSKTYFKVVDDNSVANEDPGRNNLSVVHTAGKIYTDIVISCLLDYGEPSGQQAFDNSTDLNGEYVFDELGLEVWNGNTDNLKLITHVTFNPVQKALNRQLQVDYTLRIQALTQLTA